MLRLDFNFSFFIEVVTLRWREEVTDMNEIFGMMEISISHLSWGHRGIYITIQEVYF